MEQQGSLQSVRQYQRAQICQGVGGKGETTWSNVMTAPILPEHTATC